MGNRRRGDTQGGLRLQRRLDESVVLVIEGKVVADVMLAWIGEGKVELTIKAPESTRIYRSEIWEKLTTEKGATDGTIAENKRLAKAI